MPELSKPEDFDQKPLSSPEPESQENPLTAMPLALGGAVLGAFLGLLIMGALALYANLLHPFTIILLGLLAGLGVKVGSMGKYHLAYGLTAAVTTLIFIPLSSAFLLGVAYTMDWSGGFQAVFEISWIEATLELFFEDFDNNVEYALYSAAFSLAAPVSAFFIPMRRA
jgi:hypothetical protein